MAINDNLRYLIDKQCHNSIGSLLLWHCYPFYYIFVVKPELRLAGRCNAFDKMKAITIIIITFLASCLNFQNSSNDLIGKWECYHKELEDGTTKGTDLFSGEEFEYSCDGLIIELNADFTGSESIGGLNFKYQRNDSILKLGDRNYIIELLDKNKLQIRNYSTDKTDIGGGMRMKFKKIK